MSSKKYIKFFGVAESLPCALTVIVDDVIICKNKDINIINQLVEICRFEVNVTYTGLKRVTVVNTTATNFTLAHTEIGTDEFKIFNKTAKKNVKHNGNSVIIDRLDTDGEGEWHYNIQGFSKLSYDLLVNI